MKRLIILPYAEIDIKDTVSYYREINEGIDEIFIKTIDASFKEILKNPDAYPIAKFDIRKFVVDKFSFCIYYIDRYEALYILAVFHDKRNPKNLYKRRVRK
jgi:plasmid stabilization system protein ParE